MILYFLVLEFGIYFRPVRRYSIDSQECALIQLIFSFQSCYSWIDRTAEFAKPSTQAGDFTIIHVNNGELFARGPSVVQIIPRTA